MHSYDTVTEAVEQLRKRGFDRDFNLAPDCLVCKTDNTKLHPDEFEITEVYRFEGNSDPADEAVVYAIESNLGMKGILVNGYGTSGDEVGEEMIRKLNVVHPS